MSDPDPLSLIDAADDQIRARVTEIGEANTGLRNRASVGVLRGIWETIALVVRRLYAAHVAPMYAQADRSRATGAWLRMHAAYLGVPPKPATAAEGALQALSPQTVAIDAGTPISVQDSAQRLIVAADTQVNEGAAAVVPVRAETPGAAGNVAPGSLLTMPAHPDVTVSAPRNWITTPGADAESDDALRRRVDDRWASLGAGQPEAQYRYAAESRPGIARAVVVRTPRGPGCGRPRTDLDRTHRRPLRRPDRRRHPHPRRPAHGLPRPHRQGRCARRRRYPGLLPRPLLRRPGPARHQAGDRRRRRLGGRPPGGDLPRGSRSAAEPRVLRYRRTPARRRPRPRRPAADQRGGGRRRGARLRRRRDRNRRPGHRRQPPLWRAPSPAR